MLPNIDKFRHGVGAALVALDRQIGLPVIRGRWLVVDPYALSREYLSGDVYPDLASAYDQCVSGRGDGILVMSGGATATTTSTFMRKKITWDKWGITVVGVAANVGYNSRARITTQAAMTVFTTMATPSTSTMTRESGSFITDGVVVGGKYTIACTGANNTVTFTVSAVTDLLITASATPFTSGQTKADTVSTVLVPYLENMIDLTGSNNSFHNLYFINECLSTLALGTVSVLANRNYFSNCHFSGGHNASRSAQTGDYDLTLSASECVFDRCYFGNNNVIRAATNGNLVLGVSTTQIGQNFFNDCRFISYSATTTRGAILITNAATLGGFIVFDRCKFLNWNSGAQTAIATIIIGATPNNLGILLDRCSSVGYAAVGANNDTWFTTAAASAAGTGTLAASIA